MYVGLLKKLKRRYCIATPAGLVWYKSRELAQADVQHKTQQNALGSVARNDILSVGSCHATTGDGQPLFAVVTSNGSHKFVAQDNDDMFRWIEALAPPLRSSSTTPVTSPGGGGGSSSMPGTPGSAPGTPASGGAASAAASPALHTDGTCGWVNVRAQQVGDGNAGGSGTSSSKRKRWCVLDGQYLRMYKAKGDASAAEEVQMDSRCSVIPGQQSTDSGRPEWIITMHCKIQTLQLLCKTEADSDRWVNGLQDAVDSCPRVKTSFETLMEAMRRARGDDADELIDTHIALIYQEGELKAPLTTLPYGAIGKAPSGVEYGTLEAESLHISLALSPRQAALPGTTRYHDTNHPTDLICTITQACFSVPLLCSEVCCQLAKLVARCPSRDSASNLAHWRCLALLLTFSPPSKKVIDFLHRLFQYVLRYQEKVGGSFWAGRDAHINPFSDTHTLSLSPPLQRLSLALRQSSWRRFVWISTKRPCGGGQRRRRGTTSRRWWMGRKLPRPSSAWTAGPRSGGTRAAPRARLRTTSMPSTA